MAKSKYNKNNIKTINPGNPNNNSEKWQRNMAHNRQGNLGYIYDVKKLMKDQMASFRLDEIYPAFKEETKWELYNYEKTYWTEFFTFRDKKTGEPHKGLEFAKPYIIDAFYRGLGVGVVMVKNQALVYQLSRIALNDFYEITEADGIIYAYPMDQLTAKNKKGKVPLTNEMSALTKSNPYNESWAWGLEPYAERRWQSLNARDINVVNSKRVKAIVTGNSSDNAIREQKFIHIGGMPIVVLSGDLENAWDIGLENDQKNIWEDYESFWKIYCRMRGIRFNLDQKGDRNVAGEIGNNDATFFVQESRRKRILTDLCNKLNYLFKTNVEVVSILDLEEYKQNKIKANEEELKAKAIAKYETKSNEVSKNEKNDEIENEKN